MHKTSPRHHVLLIGIDDYERVPTLNGCVNDIDAIEAILLDRLGVPPTSIQKLAAPHPWNTRAPRIPEDLPTSANIKQALASLTRDAVEPGDRVLIYYSGHGSQILPRDELIAREVLVPVDARAGGELLYDHELNELLGQIARRTSDLTVVLDCCCSAGATRSALLPSMRGVRFCVIDDAPPSLSRTRSAEPSSGLLSSLDPADPGYLVAAACQSNESACEGTWQEKTHGAFIGALLDRLEQEPEGRLEELRWADVWQSLRERLAVRYPGQHPWLIGRAERLLFGGDFLPQDPGIPISRAGTQYQLAAGSMIGLGRGAMVAVYGPTPASFPHLGAPADIAARRGVLEVIEATPSSCIARSVGADVIDVNGARGRLIAVGEPDAFVVELDPYDARLARWLSGEGSFRVVPRATSAGEGAIVEARVGRSGGLFWIGDDIYGPDAEPPFAEVPVEDHEGLFLGLVHYEKYNRALRLLRRCRDLPGALRVRVLDCRALARCKKSELHDPPLPEVSADPERKVQYAVEHGQTIAITVENRSSLDLYTNLLNCTASGKVEILGARQLEIPRGRRQTFWVGGNLGSPFVCGLVGDRWSGVERIIAVGSTTPDVDLSFLRVEKSFAEVIQWRRRESVPAEQEPGELWTATLVTMKITRLLR